MVLAENPLWSENKVLFLAEEVSSDSYIKLSQGSIQFALSGIRENTPQYLGRKEKISEIGGKLASFEEKENGFLILDGAIFSGKVDEFDLILQVWGIKKGGDAVFLAGFNGGPSMGSSEKSSTVVRKCFSLAKKEAQGSGLSVVTSNPSGGVDSELVRALSNSENAYNWAKNVISSPFKEGEGVIAKSAEFSVRYAMDVLHDVFPLGEKVIAEDTFWSLQYAKNVLRGRFSEGEVSIAKHALFSSQYASLVMERPFKMGEPVMRKDLKVWRSYVNEMKDLGYEVE